jgi:hypothetical protein
MRPEHCFMAAMDANPYSSLWSAYKEEKSLYGWLTWGTSFAPREEFAEWLIENSYMVQMWIDFDHGPQIVFGFKTEAELIHFRLVWAS